MKKIFILICMVFSIAAVSQDTIKQSILKNFEAEFLASFDNDFGIKEYFQKEVILNYQFSNVLSAGVYWNNYSFKEIPTGRVGYIPGYSGYSPYGYGGYGSYGGYGGYGHVQQQYNYSTDDPYYKKIQQNLIGIRIKLSLIPLMTSTYSTKSNRDKWDPYLAVYTGLKNTKTKYFGITENSDDFDFRTIFGLTYFPLQRLGITSQFGIINTSDIQLGVKVRF